MYDVIGFEFCFIMHNGDLSYPSSLWKRISAKSEEHDDDVVDDDGCCCVCFSGISEGGGVVRKLEREHSFHKACVDQWLLVQHNRRRTCPLCRYAITADEGSDQEEWRGRGGSEEEVMMDAIWFSSFLGTGF